MNSCPECGKMATSTREDGSNHEEGCQIGCTEQLEMEKHQDSFSGIWGYRKQFCDENFFSRLKSVWIIWWSIHTQCQHKRVEQRKWLENGTPMAETWCLDCEFHDYGHVHANPETWAVR